MQDTQRMDDCPNSSRTTASKLNMDDCTNILGQYPVYSNETEGLYGSFLKLKILKCWVDC
jgi:hypothetical protein